MPRWAYHSTSRAALPSIRKSGLEPSTPSNWGEHRGVYFTEDPEYARSIGEVLLRFPWPEGVVYTDQHAENGNYIRGSVPASKIKILREGIADAAVAKNWSSLVTRLKRSHRARGGAR